MNFLNSLKTKGLVFVIIVGLALITIFNRGLYNKPISQAPTQQIVAQKEDSSPKITSTNPSPLDGQVLLPNQEIVVSFNLPLKDVDRIVWKIDPEGEKVNIKTRVSDDRKSVTFTPNLSWKLNLGYTLFILETTEFRNGQHLGAQQIFHFRTFNYNGV